ncbi:TRAP transporter large permease [Anaerobacillus isosaccharinicus]|uniref:TRAP transporter large permease n=1 Tax=Anaerobacillus isosaccharinicus TaxID=1532552 RepID=A0A1S2KTP2_9BACI|nr:TRAP transporter large permease [Anaerobacillus isosaccharinicus]MBA5588072.1 TRAP transporter large permease [Anaerobacillus isosaccharinicus]QOY33789.1 TRAP transporter large permease [Anaerobacillus isosaccharinicus]
MDAAVQVALILLVIVGVLLLIGTPISISIGIGSAVAILSLMDLDKAMITSSQRMFTGINSFSLLAIPFFILAGVIMNNGGIAIRLVNCAKVVSGRLPGSLAHTNIVANMLFGSISGSAVAAAAAVGGTMSPLQEKEGYKREFSAAVNIASAPAGMLIPPSNTLIVYSLVSGGTSVAALFMAGYLPGLLWGLGCMIVAYFLARKYGYKNDNGISFKQALLVFLDAIPSLLLIVIVIGGIIGGVFTATEGSAIAVVYALLLSFIYRTIKVRDLPKILLDSTRTTAIVIFMIGVSSIMSWVMAFTNIPGMLAQALLDFTSNPIMILLIMNLILLVIGTFMDPTPAVLIFTPILLPIALSLGIDPVHFGILMVFNLCIGTITPPVGPVLFVGCKVANLKIENVIRPLLPFFAVAVVMLLIITFIPEISLTIPRLLDLIK